MPSNISVQFNPRGRLDPCPPAIEAGKPLADLCASGTVNHNPVFVIASILIDSVLLVFVALVVALKETPNHPQYLKSSHK